MLEYSSDASVREAAVDEAGRGALAFDVCAAAIVLPGPPFNEHQTKELSAVRDSKKLTPARMVKIAAFLKEFAVAWAVGTASPLEIDELNILNATHLAMHRALEDIERQFERKKRDTASSPSSLSATAFDKIIVDGDRFKPYASLLTPDWIPHECVPNGDATRLNIAAASILAKTSRDALVLRECSLDAELDRKYGFTKNKAYGTKAHMDGLKQFGACAHHRNSYAPVRNACTGKRGT